MREGFLCGFCALAQRVSAKCLKSWWAMTGSNRRHLRCKRRALREIPWKIGFESRDLARTNEKQRLVPVRFLCGATA